MADPDIDAKRLLGALEDVEGIVAQVDAAVGGITDVDSLWQILEMVREIRGKAFLAALEDSLVAQLHGVMTDYRYTLADGRRIVRTRARESERWDYELLTSIVAARLADSWEDEPPAAFAEKVARKMAECLGGTAPSTKWRLTPLRELGIKPEDYRTSEPGRMKVELERG